MATNDTAGAHRADGSSTPDTPSTDDTNATETPEVAALQADIERTRADLADTVDQLTAKLDVKSRVRSGVADAKERTVARVRALGDRATDAEGRPTRATLGMGGGVVAASVAVLVVVLWRRNHTPRRPRRRH